MLICCKSCCKSGNKNSVESTCLNIRFPRLSLWQVAPRRYKRRFTNLFLRDNPISGYYLWKMMFKNSSKSLFYMSLHSDLSESILPVSTFIIPYAKNFVNNTAANLQFISYLQIKSYFIFKKIFFKDRKRSLRAIGCIFKFFVLSAKRRHKYRDMVKNKCLI